MFQLVNKKHVPLAVPLSLFHSYLPVFLKAGVNMYPYVHEPQGEWLMDDDMLAECGYGKEQIQAIRLTEVDDWHDPAELLGDVKRCEAAVMEKPPKGRDPQLILRELASMVEGCEQTINTGGGEVQIVDDMEGEEMDDDY